MSNVIWTRKLTAYLRKHYPITADTHKLARDMSLPYGSVKAKASNLKLRKKKQYRYLFNIGKTKLTPAQDEILKRDYLVRTPQSFADEFGVSETCTKNRMRQLNLVIPRHIIEQRKIDSRIKPGNIPVNKGKKWTDFMSKEGMRNSLKTCFKKGGLPATTLFDGCITIRLDKRGIPHQYIRVAKAKWIEMQRWRWEQEIGPIPPKHILACKNGNTMDTDPSNWEIITMADNARRNSGQDTLSDGFVISCIVRTKGYKSTKEERDYIRQYPKIIEMKRQSLILNRKINVIQQKAS
jgi:hypothetical protein